MRLLQTLSVSGNASKHVILVTHPGVGTLEPEFQALGARIVRCPMGALFFPRYLAQLLRLRPRVVHSHLFLLSGALLTLARLTGVRTRIAHLRTTGKRDDRLRRRAYEMCMRAALAWSATNILCVSQSVADALALHGPTVEILYQGLPELAEEFIHIPRSYPPLLVQIGRICQEKGQDTTRAISDELVRRGVAHRLSFAGRVGDPAVLAAITDPGPDGTAPDYLGELNGVAPLLASASVMVHPSRREGSPGVVLEALQSGLPVVAGDIPPMREVQRNLDSPIGLTVLSLQSDVTSWADACQAALSLASDPRTGAALQDRFRTSVYDLARQNDRLEELWS